MICGSVTLSGIGVGCKDHMGGISKVYLIQRDYVDIDKIAFSEDKSEITSLALTEAAASHKFQTYEFRKGTSNMVSTATSDDANGTFSVETKVSLQFSKMDKAKRLEMMGICLDGTFGVVLDQNGIYWVIGLNNPVTASAASGETGTNFGDFGGYKLELDDIARAFPFPLSAEGVTAFKLLIDAPKVQA